MWKRRVPSLVRRLETFGNNGGGVVATGFMGSQNLFFTCLTSASGGIYPRFFEVEVEGRRRFPLYFRSSCLGIWFWLGNLGDLS